MFIPLERIDMRLLLILLLGYCFNLLGQCSTIFIPRLTSSNMMFELAQTNFQFHHAMEGKKYLIDLKPLFQSSQDDDLAQFFLPNCNCSISLKENGSGDVDSLWFNLIGPTEQDYTSKICLDPKRQIGGIGITFYADLSNICSFFWVSINTFLLHARHQINFSEIDQAVQGTIEGFENACQAFDNLNWTAGRMSSCTLTKTDLDDIQIKLGYDYYRCANQRWAPYLIGTIPTGNRPTSCYVFEPLVGSKHGSFGIGLNGDYLYETRFGSYTFMLDANYRYVFNGTERRSFDLTANGDWSRYLLVATQAEPLVSLPGINQFTHDVSVTPGSTIQLWTALHYQQTCWGLEIGYNFWWRDTEKIELFCCKDGILQINGSDIGIFDISNCCNPPSTSASTATISQAASGSNAAISDAVFTPITIDDLNLCSAQNPSTLSNTIYVSLNYEQEISYCQLYYGLAASYEVANNCSALDQWAIWANIGMQF
jgi:hypothetical protein